MKKITTFIGGILFIVFVYLCIVYNIHNGWNKVERVIFETGLIITSINSIVIVYQIRKKRNIDNKSINTNNNNQ
jgi:hypothetical protein